MTAWEDAQKAELAWWGSCLNTYAEETVQLIAADRMGLNLDPRTSVITTGHDTIVDIGGGPVSLLLKARGWRRAIVVDPGDYPAWTRARYEQAGIEVRKQTGEHFLGWNNPPLFLLDEVWIYNTLQHVEDPDAIVAGACRLARTVRLFDWIEFDTNEAHIQRLTADQIVNAAIAVEGVEAKWMVESIVINGEGNLALKATFTRPA